MLYALDQNGISYISPSVAQLFGYMPQEVIGHSFKVLVSENQSKGRIERFEGMLASGSQINRMELTFKRKDGTTFEGEINTRIYSGVDNQKTAVGLVRDITERKLVEEELSWNYFTQSTIKAILAISVEEISLIECLERSLKTLLSVPWLAAEGKGCIFLSHDEPNVLAMATQVGLSDRVLKSCRRVQFGKCLCGRAASTGRAIFASGIDNDHDELYGDVKPHGHYCVPIESEGVILGVINLYTREGHIQNPLEAAFLTSIANVLAGVINRRNAEGKLRASEVEFRQMAESMPQIVWTTQKDGQNTYFNHQWVEYTGLSLEESYGDGWLIPFHPDDKQRAWDAWQNATNNHGIYSVECRLRRADGAYHWWLIRGVPVLNDHGEIIKWFGTCTDIEDIKNSAEDLRRTNVTLDSIVENIPNIVFLKAATDLRFLMFNRAGEELLGKSSEEMLGMNDYDFFPKEQADVFNKQDREVLAGKRSMVIPEELFPTSSKGERILHTLKVPILNSDGEPEYLLGISEDITDRKRAEEALRESQAQLANAAKIARLGPWIYDLESNLFTFNDAFYDIFHTTAEREGGYIMTPDQYVGRFVHPDDAGAVGEETRKAIETDDPNFTRQVEHRIIYADGGIGYITVQFYIIKNADGKTIKTYGVNQDITEHKEAEKALIASEIRYRRLFEAAKDGILILDAETGMIVDANPFLTQMLGYTHEQFLGKTVWEIGFLKDIVSNLENFLELQLKEYVRYDDLPLETIDGRKINVEFVSNVYLVNDKRVVQCNIRDITKRKQTEERMLTSEARLKHIIESSNDVIYVLQGNKFQLVNAKFEELTGWTREEAMAENFDIFSIYTPESRKEAMERMGKRERGESVPERYTFKFKSKQGKIHELEAIVSVVMWNGNPAIMGFCRDVTEQNSLQFQVQQAVKMETVGRLVGGVAHDFNNLLTVITGHCDMAMSQLRTQDPLYHDLHEIQAASDRAAGLTRQLLAFSRKQVLEPKIINLSYLVDNLQKMLRRLIGEDVNLTIRSNPVQWNIKADPGQIEQVIVNLCTNARDAMPDGGNLVIETDNVTLEEEYCRLTPGLLAGEYVQITVSDGGCGMSSETISKIFEPFFTTKEAGKGTGLGLSTVFGIVKQSGGQITVYSEVDIGSTFKMYFPRVHEASTVTSSPSIALDANLRGTETILVVEDEATVREVTQRALQQQGYKVITAQTGGDALLLVESIDHVVDLVLTDVIMPGITGVEFVARLRHRWPDVKALYMSGYTAEAIARHGVLEEGMQFIGKPFKLTDLLKKVREVIGTSR